MTPTSGPVGSQVTFVLSSSSFPVDGPFTVWWSKTPDFDVEQAIQVASGDPGKGNIFQISATFTVPESPYATNYIRCIRAFRPDDLSDAVMFKVTPSLKVSPDTTKPGSTVTIKGTGFPAEDEASLSFDGTLTDVNIAINKVGSFSSKFTVPDVIAGEHKFTVEAAKLYTETATATMEVGPFITLTPERPEIGTQVTVSGCGFAANSEIHIKYDNASIANSPSTDENGCFSYNFNVPASSKKDHSVTAEDAAGNTATFGLPLEIKPPEKPVPVTPKGQRLGLFGTEQVTFSWTEVTDTSGLTYVIEIGENLNFFPLKPGMKKSGLTQTSCSVDIAPGTYYWRVKAVDGAGNESEWSISPYAFKVGLFSVWGLVIGAFIFLIIFILLIRSFFRRLSEYYC